MGSLALRPVAQGSGAWTRTRNTPVNSRMLCQLSYAGMMTANPPLSQGPPVCDRSWPWSNCRGSTSGGHCMRAARGCQISPLFGCGSLVYLRVAGETAGRRWDCGPLWEGSDGERVSSRRVAGAQTVWRPQAPPKAPPARPQPCVGLPWAQGAGRLGSVQRAPARLPQHSGRWRRQRRLPLAAPPLWPLAAQWVTALVAP